MGTGRVPPRNQRQQYADDLCAGLDAQRIAATLSADLGVAIPAPTKDPIARDGADVPPSWADCELHFGDGQALYPYACGRFRQLAVQVASVPPDTVIDQRTYSSADEWLTGAQEISLSLNDTPTERTPTGDFARDQDLGRAVGDNVLDVLLSDNSESASKAVCPALVTAFTHLADIAQPTVERLGAFPPID